MEVAFTQILPLFNIGSLPTHSVTLDVTVYVEDSHAGLRCTQEFFFYKVHRVYIQKVQGQCYMQKGDRTGLQGNPGEKHLFLFKQSTHATSLSLRHSPHGKQSRESVHRETLVNTKALRHERKLSEA